jgi:hypothetical protein
MKTKYALALRLVVVRSKDEWKTTKDTHIFSWTRSSLPENLIAKFVEIAGDFLEASLSNRLRRYEKIKTFLDSDSSILFYERRQMRKTRMRMLALSKWKENPADTNEDKNEDDC